MEPILAEKSAFNLMEFGGLCTGAKGFATQKWT